MELKFFLIGGSPSTGSSLLRQILNRHSKIVCLPETHLFCKSLLFTDWKKSKKRLLRKSFLGLKSSGLFPLVGLESSEIADYSRREMSKLIKDSSNIFDLGSQFVKTYFDDQQNLIWGEKTPCNVLNFSEVLHKTNRGLCIQINRNPYDVIASLMARGKSTIEAIAFYLLNTSAGLQVKDHSNFISLKYEDLVQFTEPVLTPILAKLGLSFEQQMLKPEEEKNDYVTQIDGWNYDETKEIQTGSINRFEKLERNEKDQVCYYVEKIRLKNDAFAFDSIESICKVLGYDYISAPEDYFIDNSHSIINKSLGKLIKNSNYTKSNAPFLFHD